MDKFENGQYQPFSNPPPLGPGMYIVLFEVPAIYIGSHNSNPKVASLQVRITQIVYRPKVIGQCRIIPHLDAIRVNGYDNSFDHLFESTTDQSVQTESKSKSKRGVSKKTSNKKTSDVSQDTIPVKKSKKTVDTLQDVIESVVKGSSE